MSVRMSGITRGTKEKGLMKAQLHHHLRVQCMQEIIEAMDDLTWDAVMEDMRAQEAMLTNTMGYTPIMGFPTKVTGFVNGTWIS